jgi:hypothetical protein
MSSGPPAKRFRQITLASMLQLHDFERDIRTKGKADSSEWIRTTV